ncbi:NAD(P)-binding protein [Nocardia brasiliensis]|uniref:NAD(P)-binding protein n=1 Tax=Nocardia brasiliensis TaxID=37326 RepID=UPI00366BB450
MHGKNHFHDRRLVIGAGQSGLTAARTLQKHGLAPVIVEAGPEPTGSWSHYYDTAGIVAATGSFTNPHIPDPPGRDEFSGALPHVAD